MNPLPLEDRSTVFEDRYRSLRTLVDRHLDTVINKVEPASLYDPSRYILAGGGKRVRGVLVMLAAEAVGGSPESALDAAAAVEVLHNFTLVHDDIMDRATTRRGRATVHTRWDESTAILVGDVLIGLSYATLLRSPLSETAAIVRSFTSAMVDVCEGQALDREFETRHDVTIDDYLRMIAMKTGRLLETAAEIGGRIGGGTPEEIAALCDYACAVGEAFQIQDDLLDLTADEGAFGKRIGGDLIEGKRTYLLLRAIQTVPAGERTPIDDLLANGGIDEEGIDAMRDLFRRHGVLEDARRAVDLSMERARTALRHLPETPARAMLGWLAEMLTRRDT